MYRLWRLLCALLLSFISAVSVMYRYLPYAVVVLRIFTKAWFDQSNFLVDIDMLAQWSIGRRVALCIRVIITFTERHSGAVVSSPLRVFTALQLCKRGLAVSDPPVRLSVRLSNA